ncbi:dihydroneopterin aldolase [Nesterenkonia pannonica]|uniref:dihydroneopterin aldolase n=1 Tax=Nesterenkonia pannonica TaxID=1548602 RepID=UPI0021645BD0|nr:dihydroneopterin aldolase [Nesterenkonia pannonica]
MDAEVQIPLARPGRTDDMRDSLSYADVAADLERVVTGQSYQLIERLAAVCAERVLLLDPRAAAVTLTVHKPEAPCLRTSTMSPSPSLGTEQTFLWHRALSPCAPRRRGRGLSPRTSAHHWPTSRRRPARGTSATPTCLPPSRCAA